MIRVKDPNVSLAFYTETLGMDLLAGMSNHDLFILGCQFQDFTLFFLGYDHSGGTTTDEENQNSCFAREGVLELTHNHGTESDGSFHDIEKACERFEKLNVPFKKRLTDEKMKNIAFILDPDGYWIEIVPGILRV